MCFTTVQYGIQYHELELGQANASHVADHHDAFGVDVISDNVERTVPKASTFHVMFVTNNTRATLNSGLVLRVAVSCELL